MFQDLRNAESSAWVDIEQAPDHVFCVLGDLIFHVVLRSFDLSVQLFHVVGFERHSAVKHGEQNDTRTPEISLEASVAFVFDNLGSNVCRRSALLEHDFAFLDLLGNAEVGNLDVAFAIEQNVVELDVPVEDVLRVDVANALDNLLEQHLG